MPLMQVTTTSLKFRAGTFRKYKIMAKYLHTVTFKPDGADLNMFEYDGASLNFAGGQLTLSLPHLSVNI